jgi:predicted site-specific integrase-resolvase
MEIKVTVVVAHKDRLARFGYDLIELFSTEVT